MCLSAFDLRYAGPNLRAGKSKGKALQSTSRALIPCIRDPVPTGAPEKSRSACRAPGNGQASADGLARERSIAMKRTGRRLRHCHLALGRIVEGQVDQRLSRLLGAGRVMGRGPPVNFRPRVRHQTFFPLDRIAAP